MQLLDLKPASYVPGFYGYFDGCGCARRNTIAASCGASNVYPFHGAFCFARRKSYGVTIQRGIPKLSGHGEKMALMSFLTNPRIQAVGRIDLEPPNSSNLLEEDQCVS